LPRGLAAAAFVLYALAAPPSFYWLDSAELSAAAVGLGSPHPTGFPLYCVLAKAATLLPVGELCFRINLLSALAAALAVLWVTTLVRESGRDDDAALVGGLAAGAALALALGFFRQATVAEVYAPTAAAIAGTLVLFARVARGAGAATGLALATSAGLGLALHASYRLLLALPLCALFLWRLRGGARWPLYGLLLAVGVGAAAHTYLPVRAATSRTALVDWGHPRRVGAFVDHAITAQRIRAAFSPERARSPDRVIQSRQAEVIAHHARTFAGQMSDQLGLLGVCAAAAGLGWLAWQRRTRWTAGALGLVLAGDSLYAVWLNPMGLVNLQNGVPLCVAASACAGVGVAWLARATGRAAPFSGAAATVLLVVPIALYGWRERWAAAAGVAPRAWSEAALARVPARGLALVTSDAVAAGTIYLAAAEAARPDVAVLVRQHGRDAERSRAVLARAGIHDIAPARVLASLPASTRPVAWELGSDRPPADRALVLGAPLSLLGGRAPSATSAVPPAGDDATAAWRQLIAVFSGRDADDPEARRVYAAALSQLGLATLERRDRDLARALFRAAAEVGPDDAQPLVNLGVMAGAERRFAEALRLTERALALEPVHVGALVNAARFHLRLDQDARARAYLDRALRLDPRRASAWELAGVLAARAGDLAAARHHLERALALDPTNPGARETLERLPTP
jgi:tetratricopeptide (TPR) repeat protein